MCRPPRSSVPFWDIKAALTASNGCHRVRISTNMYAVDVACPSHSRQLGTNTAFQVQNQKGGHPSLSQELQTAL